MAEIIRSGAFLQQCWSVHPLCLAVKRVTEQRAVVLVCSSCRSSHHVFCETIAAQPSAALLEPTPLEAEPALPDAGAALLTACVDTHLGALSLRAMDVFDDRAMLRCAECRRHYLLTVSQFETHQR